MKQKQGRVLAAHGSIKPIKTNAVPERSDVQRIIHGGVVECLTSSQIQGGSSILRGGVVQGWVRQQPAGGTISIGWDEKERRACKALMGYVESAKNDPEVQQSAEIASFLQELLRSINDVLYKRTEDVVGQIQKKSISRNSSKAARRKAEIHKEKPDARRDYVKRHWYAWIAKPDLYDTLEFFYEEMAKGIAEELKLKPRSKKTMQTWAKDWPLHPRAHQKKR
ncbi:hypothetical protein HNP33_003494 [Comamonas odontotermitis]|uniref:Uncharacterized protein n=1 Tax=Comamonas odontotermitis TaxID=379895 RepID=A0ABR6RJQ3_9BURK|nr:hypothetical protein [Comamonas odontotermitis]MBB6579382.1 hypothetical protein [Comamonas odontotermitis]